MNKLHIDEYSWRFEEIFEILLKELKISKPENYEFWFGDIEIDFPEEKVITLKVYS